MTKIDRNDPRFTAKALGDASWQELENVTITPGDQKEFEELAEFAEELNAAYAHADDGDKGELSDQQVAAIKAQSVRSKRRKTRRYLMFPAWASTMAATFVVGILGWTVWRMGEPAEEAVPTKSITVTVSDEAPLPPTDTVSAPTPAPEKRGLGDKSASPTVVTFEDVETFEFSQPAAVNGDAEYKAVSTLAGERLNTQILQMESDSAEEQARTLEYAKLESRRAFDVATSAPAAFRLNSRPRLAVQQEQWNRESFARIEESGFKSVLDHPLSTFSVDVDTASYSIARRFIESGQLPPVDAVRIEELINYFKYAYPEPADGEPVSITIETTSAPWDASRRLARIGVKARELPADERAAANLVFLMDVSGSMNSPDKLPLAKKALAMMLDQMNAQDRIAVVVYAGASGLALPSTTANNRETITHALERLESGGSTNGGAGIELAYQVARQHFIEGGINRVVLCTDGDFNVGASDQGSLTRLIEEKAKSGVFFTAIGLGRGNYRDDMMEILSNKGNGNYAYIDSESEARKVFGRDLLGTLQTVAKDVKIQVEFNPTQVQAYRLIGYENRALAKEDFNDDKKDAGEIGVGHSVTALYEIVPAGQEMDTGSVDALKYQTPAAQARPASSDSGELLTVKLRYKDPDGTASKLLERSHVDEGGAFDAAGEELRFAASVAAFGMLLSESEFLKGTGFEDVRQWARASVGQDAGGLRSGFVALVDKAKALSQPTEETQRQGANEEE